MQKIMIFRAGLPIPIPEINEALKPHFAADPEAKMFPTPGGVISIFNTESSIEDVARSLDELGIFFLVLPCNPNLIQMPSGLVEMLAERGIADLRTSAEEAPQVLTIDQVLDKINTSGMDSLTDEEKAILNQSNQAEGH